ncbi:uncharacterized protein J7T54_004686 [Emericellopsis cladophorae]|uniref:Integral membrane protein n=1 Tax=Emericellopsis cladophorae TaxID=2686198 RepID=A0A9P9Y6V5_9HYPO|nr:uncharacterized protein J7T54_004686 [Emericellopsis cladophorae]KAI6784140.1 hypothetical protein J7T54_004686 [Emericellopsis cladophorae]
MRLSRANNTFWILWLSFAMWCWFNSADDPSSPFFSPKRAFRRAHSLVRQSEATVFIERLLASRVSSEASLAHETERLCVGIPSVHRPHSTPLLHTLGTLSDNLSAKERGNIHIVVLLADRSPRTHPAYGEPWLTHLADDVMVYENHDDKDAHGKHEPDSAYRVIPYDVRRKGRGWTRGETIQLDHSVLIEACRQHGSPYFALMQDDVIASRDWYQRAMNGIDEVEQRSEESKQDWLYLRLFYSEMLMGWNSEEVPEYLKQIGTAYGLLAALVMLAWAFRRRPSWHSKLGIGSPVPHSFGHAAALILGLWAPAATVLVFLTGRVTLHRIMTPPQVREMPQYGCCAQGLVFPLRHLEGLQGVLREPPYRFPADMVIDVFGDERGLAKWALDPSVLQHVGMLESSDRGKRVEVWNFGFERQR